MLKNEKQYKITNKKLLGIREKIAEMSGGQTEPSTKERLILASLISMQGEMEEEVARYDLLKADTSNILKARSISELPSLITEYKIASGLTQKEFSRKIGMKEQQLQRYESEEFKSISFKNLLKLLQAIGLYLFIKDTSIEKISKEEASSHQSIA